MENLDVTFNVEEIINQLADHSIHSLQRRFLQRLYKFIYKSPEAKQIITNSTVGSLIIIIIGWPFSIEKSDFVNIKRTSLIDNMTEENKPRVYKIGEINKIEVLLDPLMSQNDNRILLEDENGVLSIFTLIDEKGLLT